VTCKPASGSGISPRNNPGCMQGNSDDPLFASVDLEVNSKICVHMGKRYPVGAFNDGCNECICDEFGGVTCKPARGSGISPRNNPGCMQGNSDDPLVCVLRGKNYTVGAFNDGCNNCTCDEFGGVTCKPAKGSGISPRNNPGCMQVNSDDPLVCVHMGKNYPVGSFNDGCSNCICDEFGGVTCKPASGSGISPRNNPGCMQGNSDDPLFASVDLEVNSRICVHMGKRYPVGVFNDGCSDCICDEFGGVTCKPASSADISPINNPGCIEVNSDDPLFASVDLEVNSRITDVSFEKNSRKKLEPDLQINSNDNLTADQIN